MQPGKQTLQNAAHDNQLSECNEQENGNFIVLCKAIFGFLSQFVPMQEEGIMSLVSVKKTAVNRSSKLTSTFIIMGVDVLCFLALSCFFCACNGR